MSRLQLLLLQITAAAPGPAEKVTFAIRRGPTAEGSEYPDDEGEQEDPRNCKEHQEPHELLRPRSALGLGLGVLRRWRGVQELPEYLFGCAGVEGDGIAASAVLVRRSRRRVDLLT